MLKLFIKLERLRSSPVLPLAGDALLGERCKPALIAAAACNDDTEGDLGDGGLGLKASVFVIEILRGLDVCKGEPEAEVGCEGGSELRSGDISAALWENVVFVGGKPYDLLQVRIHCWTNRGHMRGQERSLRSSRTSASRLVPLPLPGRRYRPTDNIKLRGHCAACWNFYRAI